MEKENNVEKKTCADETLNKIEDTVEKVSEEVKEGLDKVKDKYKLLEPETKKKLWTGVGIAASLLALKSVFKKKNKD